MEATVKGPVKDAIAKLIADIIANPSKYITFILSLFAPKPAPGPVFGSARADDTPEVTAARAACVDCSAEEIEAITLEVMQEVKAAA